MTEAKQSPDQHLRATIAERLAEYHSHRAEAVALMAFATDPACGCEPGDECECEMWERGEYIAAAHVEALLAQAATTAMSALAAFVGATTGDR